MYPATIYFWTPETGAIGLVGMYDPGYRVERQDEAYSAARREFIPSGNDLHSCQPHFLADPAVAGTCSDPGSLLRLNRNSQGLLWRMEGNMIRDMIPVLLDDASLRREDSRRSGRIEIYWRSVGQFVVKDAPKQVFIPKVSSAV